MKYPPSQEETSSVAGSPNETPWTRLSAAYRYATSPVAQGKEVKTDLITPERDRFEMFTDPACDK